MTKRRTGNGMPVVRNNDFFSFTLPDHRGSLRSSDNSPLLEKIQLDFVHDGPSFFITMDTFSSLFGMLGHGQEQIEKSYLFEWFFTKQDEDKIVFIEKGDTIIYDPNFYGKNKAAILIKMRGITKWRSKRVDKIAFMIWSNNFSEFSQSVALFYGYKIRKALGKDPLISYSFI